MTDKDPKKTTAFLLGQISTEITSVKDRLTAQNGSLDKVWESINGLTTKLTELPCDMHAERIDAIVNLAEQKAKEDTELNKERRMGKRELLIALLAALLTGGFTLLGLWVYRLTGG